MSRIEQDHKFTLEDGRLLHVVVTERPDEEPKGRVQVEVFANNPRGEDHHLLSGTWSMATFPKP